eukprot:CAMPEP_0178999522 /NCGR_PEP_ID=MMETSP0795-20121207/10114_1 /TAXON_ID=88552 /ORGANISM="Amoebophrya sp., Strain Ameob2" /LENGTH=242 /DNA_ID=CAMNT_0020692319 /DNA_START=9 /DNA_END=738 /DNA_ORIENTATION=+
MTAGDERPRESLVKYDPALELGPASQTGSSGNKLKQQQENNAPASRIQAAAGGHPARTVAAKEWVESERNMIQYVSAAQATRLDVIQLQEALDHKLMERQARETGICPVREELYSQCFDELIRQICINCPERGLLLLRVRDELRMTIAAYQTLYSSSVTFGTRKQLQSEQGKSDMENTLADLEKKKKSLEAQVVELKNQAEAIERREAEKRAIEDRKKREETEFLKHQGQHLESFLSSVEKS